jgi:hypothetical protein
MVSEETGSVKLTCPRSCLKRDIDKYEHRWGSDLNLGACGELAEAWGRAPPPYKVLSQQGEPVAWPQLSQVSSLSRRLLVAVSH